MHDYVKNMKKKGIKYDNGLFGFRKSKILWLGHKLLYKIHMQVKNSNKMGSNK